MLPVTNNAGVLWLNQQMIKKIHSYIEDDHSYLFRSSILTCIPSATQTYKFVLDKIEMPFTDNLTFEQNIYNQNLE